MQGGLAGAEPAECLPERLAVVQVLFDTATAFLWDATTNADLAFVVLRNFRTGCRVEFVFGKFMPQRFSHIGKVLPDGLFVFRHLQSGGLGVAGIETRPLGQGEPVISC